MSHIKISTYLPDNSPVWVDMPPNSQAPGKIVSAAPQPRSYFVNVLSGQVRRNRSQLCQKDYTDRDKSHFKTTKKWQQLLFKPVVRLEL